MAMVMAVTATEVVVRMVEPPGAAGIMADLAVEVEVMAVAAACTE